MHSGPIVSVSHPGAVHCVTIGMKDALPPFAPLVTPSTHFETYTAT